MILGNGWVYKRIKMNTIEIIQNEVKSYIIPKSSILYVSKEIITSKDVMHITIYFSGGQVVRISFSIDAGLEAYLEIKSQLEGTVYT